MVEIPPKLYFSIQEASKLTGVKAHVLRFWESEFPDLKPKKSQSGRRTYQRKDLEKIFEIKHLLYERRFTIEGARNYLKQKNSGAIGIQLDITTVDFLNEIKQHLNEIKQDLATARQNL